MHELPSQLFNLKLTCLITFSDPDCFALTTFLNYITQKSSSLLTKIQNALLSLEVSFKTVLKTRCHEWADRMLGHLTACMGCHVQRCPQAVLLWDVQSCKAQGRKSSWQRRQLFCLTGFPNFTLGPVVRHWNRLPGR